MEDTQNTDSIAEARRYVANAEEIIQRSKYDPETKSYKDKKYVRIAGDTLWKGCLIALDVRATRCGRAASSPLTLCLMFARAKAAPRSKSIRRLLQNGTVSS